MLPTSATSELIPTLLLSMVFRSLAVSLSPAVSASALRFGLLDSNLFLLPHRYNPVDPLPSLFPISLQCYLAPVVAEGIDSKFATKPIGPLWIWLSNSAILQFLLFSFLRMLLRPPPTLKSSTRAASSDLPPYFDHFPHLPKIPPTFPP